MKIYSPKDTSNTPKPTIVQIVGYFPPHLGGMEIVAQEISLELARAHWPVEIISSNVGSKHSPKKEHRRNYIIHRLRTVEFAHTPFMPALAWRLFRVKKPAIFHLHLSQAYLPEIVWLAAKIRRIPYIVHFHLDVDPSGRFGFLFVLYKRFVQPKILRSADHVIALSPEQVDMIKNRYGLSADKVSFIPNGVSQKFLDIGVKPRELHSPLRILFVGRLAPQKRVNRLINALYFTNSTVQLNIIGDGEDRADLEELTKELGLKNIFFDGAMKGKKLTNAYEQADVFVLPSDKEGMPLVLFEAMAAGMPVIGSDVQGIREHLEGTGVLVQDPSPRSFAKAIDNFSKNSSVQFALLSQASRDKAQYYSWLKLSKQLEELYQKLIDKQPKRNLTRLGLLIGVGIWWLTFLVLRVIPGVPNFVVNIVGFSFIVIVPGMLSILCLRLKALEAWGKLALAVGLSILELMVVGLIGNTVLQWGGIQRPLNTPFLLAEISVLIMLLMTNVWYRSKGWKLNIRAKVQELMPSRIDWGLSLFPIIFVLMSILGATSLNNGGTNLLTMSMLIGIAGFGAFLVYQRNKISDTTVATTIFFISLSLLLMTSLRGWFITGHDIQLEYQVFQIAKTNGVWQIQGFRDPYNACLSITILPTIFANILKIFNPYIYKVFFQILFATSPVIIYLFIRKWASVVLAFLATLYFISFPTFFSDMPFLNRQEIAFIFFTLMLYIIFHDKIKIQHRRIFFLVLGLGLILSHYSTTYSVIAILFLAAGIRPILMKTLKRLKRYRISLAKSSLKTIQSSAKELKIITLPMILILICGSVLWTTVFTNTGNSTVTVLDHTASAVWNSFKGEQPKSNDTSYNLFSWKGVSPSKQFSNYINNAVKSTRSSNPSQYYPVTTYQQYPIKITTTSSILPLTRFGIALEKIGLNVRSFNFVFRQMTAKLLQILVIFGLIYALYRRKYIRLLDSDFITLSIASLVFVALQVVLPVLSVEYGLLRAFQQSLILLGLFTVLGSIALFAWLPSRILRLSGPVILAILLFLSSTGVITHLLGGYDPQLNLDNSGTYYDIYYTHKPEISAINWLNNIAQQAQRINDTQVEVQADQYTTSRLASYSQLNITSDIYPGLIKKSDYVFLGYSNVNNHQATTSYNGDLITYTYPVQFLNQQKNLIYSNGGAEVYK